MLPTFPNPVMERRCIMRSTFVSLLLAVTINIISYYICKWLDLLFLLRVIGQKVCVTNPNKLENL